MKWLRPADDKHPPSTTPFENRSSRVEPHKIVRALGQRQMALSILYPKSRQRDLIPCPGEEAQS